MRVCAYSHKVKCSINISSYYCDILYILYLIICYLLYEMGFQNNVQIIFFKCIILYSVNIVLWSCSLRETVTYFNIVIDHDCYLLIPLSIQHIFHVLLQCAKHWAKYLRPREGHTWSLASRDSHLVSKSRASSSRYAQRAESVLSGNNDLSRIVAEDIQRGI